MSCAKLQWTLFKNSSSRSNSSSCAASAKGQSRPAASHNDLASHLEHHRYVVGATQPLHDGAVCQRQAALVDNHDLHTTKAGFKERSKQACEVDMRHAAPVNHHDLYTICTPQQQGQVSGQSSDA